MKNLIVTKVKLIKKINYEQNQIRNFALGLRGQQ